MPEAYAPAPTVEFAFGYVGPFTTVPSSAWVDVSAYVPNTSPQRGRSSELELFSAGSMSFTLEARDRRFDPLNASGPYYGNLVPNTPVRLRGIVGATSAAIWYGYVDSFRHQPTTFDSVVEVQCSDGFKILAGKKLPQSVYESVVLADSPSLYWKLGEADGAIAADSSGNKNDGTYSTVAIERASNPLVSYANDQSVKTTANGPATVQANAAAARITALPVTLEMWVRSDGNFPRTTATQAWGLFWQGDPTTANNRMVFEYQLGTSAAPVDKLAMIRPGGTTDQWLWTLPTRLDDGNTHHLVVVVETATSTLYIDGEAQLSPVTTTTNTLIATSEGLWLGYPNLDAGANRWVGWLDDVAYYPSALSAAQVAAHYVAGTNPWDGDTTGERYGRILDLIGWPAALRDIDAGEVLLGPADLAGMAVLAYLQLIAQSEQGRAFMGPDGKAVFDGNSATITGTSGYTFSGSTGLLDERLTFSLDDSFQYDQAIVQRKYGQPQMALASGVTEPTRTISLTGLLSLNDAWARALAEQLVYRYADARTRIDGWMVQPEQVSNDWATVLGLDIGDVVTVTATPASSGAAITVDLFLESIRHNITDNDWTMALWGSPVDNTNYFTWGGTSAQGWGTGVWR